MMYAISAGQYHDSLKKLKEVCHTLLEELGLDQVKVLNQCHWSPGKLDDQMDQGTPLHTEEIHAIEAVCE